MIGDHHDLVRPQRIGQGKAERSTGGRSVQSVGIAVRVAAGGGDKRHIDMQVPILNGAKAAAVGAQHRCFFHFSQRTGAADGTVHGTFNMRDHAGLDQRH